MSSKDNIFESYASGYNDALALYEEGKVEECKAAAQALLNESALPRYHRMKLLLLLTVTLESWHDIEECRLEAEKLWMLVRRFHPAGEDAEADELLAELRESLDELQQNQIDEQPPYEPYGTEEGDMDENEAETDMTDPLDEPYDDPVELAKAEDDDPDELARADAAALAETPAIEQAEASTSAAAAKPIPVLGGIQTAKRKFIPLRPKASIAELTKRTWDAHRDAQSGKHPQMRDDDL